MTNNQTLADFLKLDSLKISNYVYGLDDIVIDNLMPKYGERHIFHEFPSDKPAYKIENFFMSSENTVNNFFGVSYLEKSLFGFGSRKELNNEEIENIKKGMSNIKERISKSDEKELNDCVEILTNIAERDCPELFYHSMINLYYGIMKDNERFSEAVTFLLTRVRPILRNNENVMSLKEISSRVGEEDFFDARLKLPKNIVMDINQNKDLTTSDVDDLEKLFMESDKKRNELHKRILLYGEKYLKKDYLDVFVDIMSRESFPGRDFLHLSPVKKGKSLIFDVGLIDMPSRGMGEFSRYYDDGDTVPKEREYSFLSSTKSLAERAYRKLRRAREEDKERKERYVDDYSEIKYKSNVRDGRSEAQDIRLLNKIERRFKEYIAFNGDYAFKTMHGHHIFGKLIEIDVNKIREMEKYPDVKIREIKDYIASLLPKPKRLI